MEPKEAPGKETMGTRKKSLPFPRPRLYMLERRKTDPVVESSVPGDYSGTLTRSQSHRTEYNQKLQGNLQKTHGLGSCTPSSVPLTLPLAKEAIKVEEKIKHYLPL